MSDHKMCFKYNFEKNAFDLPPNDTFYIEPFLTQSHTFLKSLSDIFLFDTVSQRNDMHR